MGNYGEPNVEIVYEYHEDREVKTVYLLEYDPQTGVWNVRTQGHRGDKELPDVSVIDLT